MALLHFQEINNSTDSCSQSTPECSKHIASDSCNIKVLHLLRRKKTDRLLSIEDREEERPASLSIKNRKKDRRSSRSDGFVGLPTSQSIEISTVSETVFDGEQMYKFLSALDGKIRCWNYSATCFAAANTGWEAARPKRAEVGTAAAAAAERTKKTLAMREIPEDSVKKLLSNKESLTAYDINVFVR
ncbi:hypothetical protein KSP39_PZI010549 [Platanthera zijinensis]|uniref:Uncharacterized protein n=1 Tax=Platanthera zijinensis TaxID=2320716 RepID=A0AAP0BJY5_9ASPA